MKKVGIYKVECIIDNKKYIGQSKDIEKRFKKHLTELKNNRHLNSYMQHSFNRYGIEYFVFEVIELCLEEELMNKEIFYIDKLKSYNRNFGFNVEYGGLRNKKIAEETKRKISKSMTGIKKPLIVVEKMRIAQKKRSDEISNTHKGNTYTKGIARSKEFKEKISKSLIGNKRRLGVEPHNIKSVLQYDKDMNFIKKWNKISDVKKTLGFNHSSIVKCCQDKLKTAYGFKWKYESDIN